MAGLDEFHTFCSGCCWDSGIAELATDVVTNIAGGYYFMSDPTLILSRSNRLKDMFSSGWAIPEHSTLNNAGFGCDPVESLWI